MRKISLLLVIVMALLVGCGKNQNNKDVEEQVEVAYTINDVTVVPGTEFDLIKESFGEPIEYSEAVSCYFDGMDKMFKYEGFEVRTYPKDGKDYIQDLCISSDKYKTDKNISVGSSIEEIMTAYGKGYTQTGSMYKYSVEDKKYIYFFLLNDSVKYFGYAIEASN